jgi:hypothetical protein
VTAAGDGDPEAESEPGLPELRSTRHERQPLGEESLDGVLRGGELCRE